MTLPRPVVQEVVEDRDGQRRAERVWFRFAEILEVTSQVELNIATGVRVTRFGFKVGQIGA